MPGGGRKAFSSSNYIPGAGFLPAPRRTGGGNSPRGDWARAVQQQVEFYLSDVNLRRDAYLRGRLVPAPEVSAPTPSASSTHGSVSTEEPFAASGAESARTTAVAVSSSAAAPNHLQKALRGQGLPAMELLHLPCMRQLNCLFANQIVQAVKRSKVLGAHQVELDHFIHRLEPYVHRPVNKEEQAARTLYVENLPVLGLQQIREGFRDILPKDTYVDSKEVNMQPVYICRPKHPRTQKIQRYAFIEFEEASIARIALDHLQNAWPSSWPARQKRLFVMEKEKWNCLHNEFKFRRRGNPTSDPAVPEHAAENAATHDQAVGSECVDIGENHSAFPTGATENGARCDQALGSERVDVGKNSPALPGSAAEGSARDDRTIELKCARKGDSDLALNNRASEDVLRNDSALCSYAGVSMGEERAEATEGRGAETFCDMPQVGGELTAADGGAMEESQIVGDEKGKVAHECMVAEKSPAQGEDEKDKERNEDKEAKELKEDEKDEEHIENSASVTAKRAREVSTQEDKECGNKRRVLIVGTAQGQDESNMKETSLDGKNVVENGETISAGCESDEKTTVVHLDWKVGDKQTVLAVRQYCEHAVTVAYVELGGTHDSAFVRLPKATSVNILLRDIERSGRCLGCRVPNARRLTAEEEKCYIDNILPKASTSGGAVHEKRKEPKKAKRLARPLCLGSNPLKVIRGGPVRTSKVEGTGSGGGFIDV